MSRCSLRLDGGLPLSNASFNVGGANRSSSLRLRNPSPSESVLRPPAGRSSLLSSSSDVSDASLLSSLLDQSSFQEPTLLPSFWGLDHDYDANRGAMATSADAPADERVPCGSYCDSSSEETETCTIYTRGRGRQSRTDLIRSGALRSSRAAAHFLSLPILTLWAWLRSKVTLEDGRGRAARDLDATMIPEEGHTHDSLCEDCQEKQRSGGSGGSRLWELTCSAATLTGQALSWTGTFLWPVVCRFSSSVWSVGRSAGGTLIGFFKRFCVRCRAAAVDLQRTGFAAWRPLLLLALLLLLLPPLLWLCRFAPPTDVSEENAASDAPKTSNGPPEGGVEERRADESERLGALERRLDELTRRVEVGGQRNGKLLMELQQERRVAAVETERRLQEVRALLEETRRRSGEQLQTQSGRLERLERLLQTLSDVTAEVQQRSQAATPTLPAVLGSSHDALLGEVSRLDSSLEDVRRELKGLQQREDVCPQLAAIQQTVSAQLSAQLRPRVLALLYGGRPAGGYGVTPESLLHWISEHYVGVADLQEALLAMERTLLLSIGAERLDRDGVRRAEPAGNAVTSEEVRLMVSAALRMFSEDRTGLADYALESGGGSVLSTRCSETFKTSAALLTMFDFPLWYFSQSPRVVIQPDVHPGNCWPFRGSSGFLVISLSMKILPSAVSMEHVPKALTADGTLLSAPRDFTVYGLHDENEDDGTLLGTFTYDQAGDALQTFPVTEKNDKPFGIIELKVLSNWGHPHYTCLYRFRVHGTPSST